MRITISRIARWFLALAMALSLGVAVAPTAAGAATAQVVVTNGLRLDHGSGLTLCTLGPVGTDDSGRLIGITAGHCAAGAEVYFPGRRDLGPIGHYAYVSREQAYHDYAVIEFDPAKVTLSSNGPALRVDGIAPGGLPPVGSNVCKDGRTSGLTCGLVGSTNGGLITSFATVLPGDSGGPVVLARGDGTATEWVGIVTRISLTFPPFVFTSAKNILDDLNTHGAGSPGVGFTPVSS